MNITLTFAAATAIAVAFAVTFAAPAWLRRWAGRGTFLPAPSHREITVEALFAAAVGVLAGLYLGSPAAAATFAAAGWLFAFATRADLLTSRIPREPCWAVFIVTAIASASDWSMARLAAAGVAVALVLFVTGLAALLSRGGLGSGDIRFLVAVSPLVYWVGISPLLVGLLVAAALQVAGKAAGLLHRGPHGYPFAPALSLGLLLTFTWSVVSGYGATADFASLL